MTSAPMRPWPWLFACTYGLHLLDEGLVSTGLPQWSTDHGFQFGFEHWLVVSSVSFLLFTASVWLVARGTINLKPPVRFRYGNTYLWSYPHYGGVDGHEYVFNSRKILWRGKLRNRESFVMQIGVWERDSGYSPAVYSEEIGPKQGARIVARAWQSPRSGPGGAVGSTCRP